MLRADRAEVNPRNTSEVNRLIRGLRFLLSFGEMGRPRHDSDQSLGQLTAWKIPVAAFKPSRASDDRWSCQQPWSSLEQSHDGRFTGE
jgi:hypothetical protein